MAEQDGLSLTWWEILKTFFIMRKLIIYDSIMLHIRFDFAFLFQGVVEL